MCHEHGRGQPRHGSALGDLRWHEVHALSAWTMWVLTNTTPLADIIPFLQVEKQMQNGAKLFTFEDKRKREEDSLLLGITLMTEMEQIHCNSLWILCPPRT